MPERVKIIDKKKEVVLVKKRQPQIVVAPDYCLTFRKREYGYEKER